MKDPGGDWRLRGQERYLTGREFVWREYTAPRPDWDHDHCEFCWAKFSGSGEAMLVPSAVASNSASTNVWL